MDKSLRALGENLLKAIESRDYDGIGRCFASESHFRALVPPGLREAQGTQAITDMLKSWWSDLQKFELQNASVEEFSDRLHVAYQIKAHNGEAWKLIQHHAYLKVENGKIVGLDLICAGFRPYPAAN